MNPAEPPYSERHAEVLRAAMQLVGERGFEGASLRELARRVGVSQPSLYHYFERKEDLVAQVIDWYSSTLFERLPTTPVSGLRALLQQVSSYLRELYQDLEHATFVRFMVQVTMARPEVGEILGHLLMDRSVAIGRELLRPFVETGELLAADGDLVMRITVDALGMRLLKEHVLGMPHDYASSPEVYSDAMIDLVCRGARARATAAEESTP